MKNPRFTGFKLKALSIAVIATVPCLHSFAQDITDDGDVYELSPFEVTTDGDQGYEAQNTLSGTRLNTPMKDLGITMTALTQEFWEDTAFSSVNDMLIFTPGAEKDSTQQGDGNSRGQYWGDNTRIRGIAVENIVRNQFRTNIPSDTYNASRFEFSRGPNSILFGVTRDTAGLINRTTNDGVFHDILQYRNRIDEHGSMRHEFDINRVLIEDKLAVRGTFLNEQKEHWIKPGFQDQTREYLAVTYRPIPKLTTKVRYEHFDWTRAAIDPSIHRDEVTPWINAGMPGVNNSADGTGVFPEGTESFTGGHRWALIRGFDAEPFMMDMRNFAKGSRNRLVTGAPAALPEDFLPLDYNAFGAAGIQKLGGFNIQGVIQYELNEKIHFEYAVNAEELDYEFIAAGRNRLYVDANTTLSDGVTINPNFGQYYSLAEPTFFLDQERMLRAQRFSASFSHDFEENGKSWLGKHDLVAMWESNTDEFYWDRRRLVNQTPLPGARAISQTSNNPDNYARIITYLDPENGKWAAPIDARDFQSILNEQPGVNYQWANQPNNNTANKTIIDSVLLVWQNRWWNDKIVGTVGWRRDEITQFDKAQPIPFPRASARAQGLALNEDMTGTSPETSNFGLVFHAIEDVSIIEHISFFYNESDSFAVQNFGELVDGSAAPARTGDSHSYGSRFGLFEGRVSGSLTFFEVTAANSTFRNNDINNPMGDLFDLIGMDHLDDANRNDLKSLKSEGWEFQVSANITKNWRVMVGVDHYKTYDSDVAPITLGLIEQYRSAWLQNPDAIIPDNENETAQMRFDDMMTALDLELAQAGGYKNNERRYKATFLTNYKFTDGAMKGFSFGGNVVWRDKNAVGFPYRNDPDLGLVPDNQNPFYGDDILNLSLHASYGRKIWNDKIDWKIQVNLRNIGDEDPFITGMVASEADPNTGIISRMSRGNPQTWVITNTFKF